MSQVMLTLLIRIRLRAGWRGARWGRWSSRGRVLFVAILETSCLGCLDPLHPPSMAVPLIVSLCLALAEEQDMSKVYVKSQGPLFLTDTSSCHFLLFPFPFQTAIWADVREPVSEPRSVKWTHTKSCTHFNLRPSKGKCLDMELPFLYH